MIVSITFDASASVTSILELELCQEAEITINNTTYDINNPSGTEVFPNGAASGCDSIVEVIVHFRETPIGNFEQGYCIGQEVEINGTIYNESNPSGMETIVNGSSLGCDSITMINLTFEGVFTGINPVLCPQDYVEVNGIIYDESNPIGTEIIPNGSFDGCDSTIYIDLSFYNDTTFVDTVFCRISDSLVIQSEIFDSNRLDGSLIIPNGSYIGCDSIVNISLRYEIDSFLFQDTLCWYDTLVINDHIYTFLNPTGKEYISSPDGCDSLLNLNLFFPYESADISIVGPDTVCYGETAFLYANSTLENPSYDWYKNDSLFCTDCETIESPVIKNDVFSILAEDEYGCELYLDRHVINTEISYDVYFPNAITPNGDGFNDIFTVFGNKKIDQVISLSIYDRWGGKVFLEENFPVNKLNHGWNGVCKSEDMQSAVFVYVASVQFIDGTIKEYAGDFIIIK